MQQDTFYPHLDIEQVNFYKKKRLYIIGSSLRDGKVTTYLQFLINGTFQPTFDKIYFLYQHFQTLYDVTQKEIENLDFVQCVDVEVIDSLKNSTKYFLIFDDSCEEIYNSKANVDIATAGRHR